MDIPSTRPAQTEVATAAPVLLITAWHLPKMRWLPRTFWNVRRLDFATRSQPGCLWVHRWISRRSVMLTTAWDSEPSAMAWLGGAAFRGTAAVLSQMPGTVARRERYLDGAPVALEP